MNGIHQTLAYTDDINLMGYGIRTVEKMQICQQILTRVLISQYLDKSQYMEKAVIVMLWQIECVTRSNNSYEEIKAFRYLGLLLTKQKLYS